MRNFEYRRPKTARDACRILKTVRGSVPFCGGTDLLLRMRDGRLLPSCVVDIKAIPGAAEISYSPKSGLTLGNAVTFNQVAESDVVRKNYPLLAQASETVAAYQIRNRATVAGNICNASPSADISPSLIVLEAQVIVQGLKKSRIIPIDKFFTGPGKNALQHGEIVTGIRVPAARRGGCGIYIKHSRRKALDLALVGVAAHYAPGRGVRLALGAVGPTPIRVCAVENMFPRNGAAGEELVEEAAVRAHDAARPIDDIRSTRWYREEMVRVLSRRALRIVLGMNGSAKGARR